MVVNGESSPGDDAQHAHPPFGGKYQISADRIWDDKDQWEGRNADKRELWGADEALHKQRPHTAAKGS